MGSEQFTRNKQYFVDRLSREMESDLAAPELPRRDALAAACRILAREGHESAHLADWPGVPVADDEGRIISAAMAAGGYREVKAELAEEALDFLLQPSIVKGTFHYWARRNNQ